MIGMGLGSRVIQTCGISGPTQATVERLTIELPQLAMQFDSDVLLVPDLPFGGLLGHAGFMSGLRVSFVSGSYFEIDLPT